MGLFMLTYILPDIPVWVFFLTHLVIFDCTLHSIDILGFSYVPLKSVEFCCDRFWFDCGFFGGLVLCVMKAAISWFCLLCSDKALNLGLWYILQRCDMDGITMGSLRCLPGPSNLRLPKLQTLSPLQWTVVKTAVQISAFRLLFLS